ncbi:TetR/AcrR family transcriptional regulator [Saccharopolyspora rosea]|uniref:TetR/AcrR family transcriptional regulator n=1 Tax=Saccharopolyspora rosea TaxID=524884 RepID=A0ABW3FVS3_9PSEU|nr:TetR/AcrR family transcriptional regulator [Saccharopolyspora rosea]
MTSTDNTPHLRADARRNRDRIIAAARTAFVDRGIDVPMEEIARAAGVGVGTLYRRFPDRDSLILAVGRDAFQRVRDDAHRATDDEPDPWRALTGFLHTAADLRTVVRLSMLSPRARSILSSDPDVEALRNELLAVLDRLVRAAQDNGSLRADVSAGDLAMVMSLVAQGVNGMPEEMRRDAAARYMTLMLDGLQASPGTPLPGRAVTIEDLSRVRHAASHAE